MGLQQVSEEDANAASGSRRSKSSGSSSSKSSSSDDSPFPKYQKRCPEAVIRKTDNGEYKAIRYPNTPEIRYRKDWYTAPWERDDPLPEWENWENVWLSKEDFRRTRMMVKEVLGLDFDKLLRENPEKAKDAASEASNKYNPDTSKPDIHRNCGVCDKRLNPVTSDCREIENTLVCERHSVEDLHNNGLI